MLVMLSKERVERFAAALEDRIEKYEGMKGPFKNNALYQEEIVECEKLRDLILTRLENQKVQDVKEHWKEEEI